MEARSGRVGVLAIGDWQLDIGDWVLAIGDWQLAIGDWVLDMGERWAGTAGDL